MNWIDFKNKKQLKEGCEYLAIVDLDYEGLRDYELITKIDGVIKSFGKRSIEDLKILEVLKLKDLNN